MSLLDIFEKVNLTTPIEQRAFFNYFEDSVNEILAMNSGFGDFIFEKDAEYIPPTALADENVVRPLYHSAIVDNIVFLAGGEDTYKAEFLRKSRDAFLKYWNDNAKGRKMKVRRQ